MATASPLQQVTEQQDSPAQKGERDKAMPYFAKARTMPPGKMTMEKPRASRSAASEIGVAPPSTMFAKSGTRPRNRSVTRRPKVQ